MSECVCARGRGIGDLVSRRLQLCRATVPGDSASAITHRQHADIRMIHKVWTKHQDGSKAVFDCVAGMKLGLLCLLTFRDCACVAAVSVSPQPRRGSRSRRRGIIAVNKVLRGR